MTGFDLFQALSNVDERYVKQAEVNLDYKFRNKIMVYASVTACVVIICLSISMVKNHINKNEKEGVLLGEWKGRNMNDKYTALTWNGLLYIPREGTCEISELGKKIGEGRIGLLHEEDLEITKLNVEGIENSIYQINDIAIDFAVAVKLETEEEYYVFCNKNYLPRDFEQFSKDSSLRNNLQVKSAKIYQENDEILCSFDEISIDAIFDTLFYGENIPAFFVHELPEWFIYEGDDMFLGTGGTKGYFPNITKKEIENEEFFEDKRYGIDVVVLNIEYLLTEQEYLYIGIKDGGFVTTNIGYLSRCFYVGEENVKAFITYLKENYEFEEFERKQGGEQETENVKD